MVQVSLKIQIFKIFLLDFNVSSSNKVIKKATLDVQKDAANTNSIASS